MKSRQIEILLHVLFWLFSIWMLNQNFIFEATEVREINGVRQEYYVRDYQLFYTLAISIVAKMLWVYGNTFWGFRIFLKDKNLSAYLTRLSLLLTATILLELACIYIFAIFFPLEEMHFSAWLGMWQLNVLLYVLYYGISQAYILTKNWWKQERLKERLEREKLATELNFLKSQINPHFLFNTLNNLFAIAQENQQVALSKGISGLSSLMRYMLDECKADRVLLEKEISFIQSLIDMQQLRIAEEDEVIIALNIKGDIQDQRIAPLVLIPFVENAFKHGINWQKSSFIRISFHIDGKNLDFEVVNSYFSLVQSEHQVAGGIGLENVRRRLALIYPERHHLDISEENEVFSVQLKLELD